MSEEAANILQVFSYDAELALEQYLVACEIDCVKPNLFIVDELETWVKK